MLEGGPTSKSEDVEVDGSEVAVEVGVSWLSDALADPMQGASVTPTNKRAIQTLMPAMCDYWRARHLNLRSPYGWVTFFQHWGRQVLLGGPKTAPTMYPISETEPPWRLTSR